MTDPRFSGSPSPESGGPGRVLVLGGTTEGRRLASSYDVITSLAGRTSSPLLPPGEVRIGGFGGVDGLAAFLRERRITAVVDATHPFAARITANAAAATRLAGVPLLVLRRPGWVERPGDVWHRVRDLKKAAETLPHLGRRVFLTTGRQGLDAFAGVDGCWFLSRSVEPPEPPMPRALTVLLDRGPFTPEGERDLLREHAIDVLVTKDSGGSDAKLTAARALAVPVVMVVRPALAADVETATTVEEATAWLHQVAHR